MSSLLEHSTIYLSERNQRNLQVIDCWPSGYFHTPSRPAHGVQGLSEQAYGVLACRYAADNIHILYWFSATTIRTTSRHIWRKPGPENQPQPAIIWFKDQRPESITKNVGLDKVPDQLLGIRTNYQQGIPQGVHVVRKTGLSGGYS